jgi:hypothetical protein
MSASAGSRALPILAAAALIAVGCGGTDTATSGSSNAGGPPSPPARLVVDVTIKGGQVTPTNKPLQGAVGEPIVIKVNSDAADEVHVHSTPEHEFGVEAKDGQQFQFTVDVPGKVDVELHELKKTIATITVQ